MERTPSPPRRVHTPPAPLHGVKFDSYEPYSPPRRSSRVAAQRPHYQQQLHSPRARSARETTPTPTTSRKAAAARTSSQTFSPPSSPASPFKHTSPRATRRVHLEVGPVEYGSDHAAPTPNRRHLSAMESHAMLPTPAKTPRKRALQSQETLSSTARVLFAPRPATVEEAMPSPRKNRKSRKNLFTLESFAEHADDEGEKIEVYTDSKERVPEVDETEDNPFLSKKGKAKSKANGASPPKTRKRDAKTAKMEEAVSRDEGMIYLFRGRKIFRKFEGLPSNASEEEAEFSGDELRRLVGTEAQRPFTRASIKPRRLFQEQLGPDDADEEAVTDIEVSNAGPSKPKHLARKVRQHEEVATPVKPKFKDALTPATPPSTVRSRHGKKAVVEHPMEIDEEAETPHASADEMETSPAANTRSKNPSPFDSWLRVKPTARKSKKRGGEELQSSHGKRTKSEQNSNSAMSVDSV
ncbi:hypothetical protein BCR34DRAFT_623210 [Clohesyomyces aquaticus]|uniref:Uncharacterized protein n=1 Tax=Clohesyomyces aquaticus TaxID=1231657 RepID=A0A1Y1ZX59_9PLEO|nr:hypothetical protein BCR34DRAFT_623210 [Clohesyomyces aquaticus]